jgi:hypothetical protein
MGRRWLTAALASLGLASSLLIGTGLLLNVDKLRGFGSLGTLAYTIALILWLAKRQLAVALGALCFCDEPHSLALAPASATMNQSCSSCGRDV